MTRSRESESHCRGPIYNSTCSYRALEEAFSLLLSFESSEEVFGAFMSLYKDGLKSGPVLC